MEVRHRPSNPLTRNTPLQQPSNEAEPDSVRVARVELMRAEAQFNAQVHRASALGKELVERTISNAKPVLLTVAVGAGLAGIALVYVLARNSRRPEPVFTFTHKPKRPSMLRTFAVAALSAGARMVASNLLHKFTEHRPLASEPEHHPSLPSARRTLGHSP
jgi:hypothetical protein